MGKFNRLFDYKQGLRFYASYRKAVITLLFNLYPVGHFGFIPIIFLTTLPLMHLIVLLAATVVPISAILTVVKTGAKVDVPA